MSSPALARIRLEFFPVQPEERPRLLLGLLIYFLIISGVTLGRNARDSLFLNSGLDVRLWLPWMYVMNAVAAVACSAIYAAFVDRIDRRLFVTITTALFMGTLVAARMALLTGQRWVFVALYILAQVIWLFSVMQFWTFAGDLFDTRQAKRIFPVINAGGLIGMVVAGFGGKPLVLAIGTENLIIIWAGLLGGSLSLLLLIRSGASPGKPTKPDAKVKSTGSLFTDGVSAFRAFPLLRLLAGITLTQWIVFTLVDYVFSQTVRVTYPGKDELTAFLGVFRGAGGALALLVQILIAPSVIRIFGVGRTILFHPLFLVPATFYASAQLTFWSSVSVKFGDHVLLYTIQESSYQLLYNPLPLHQRGRIRAFVEGSLRPISMGVAGLILVASTAVFTNLGPLCSAAFGLSILWFLIATRIGSAYITSLINGLRSGTEIDRAAAAQRTRTLDAREMAHVLLEGIRSPDVHLAVFSLQMLQETWTPDRRLLVESALARPEEEVRAAALETLAEVVPEEAFPILEQALSDPSVKVRAAAAAAMGKLEDERVYDALEKVTEDPNPRVQEAAFISLTQAGGLDGVVLAAEQLKAMLVHPEPSLRRTAARTLGSLRARSMTLPLLQLLQDGDLRVRKDAIDALGKIHDVRSADELLQAMLDRPLRLKARKAIAGTLSRYPDRLVPVLSAAAGEEAYRPIWPDLLDLLKGARPDGMTGDLERLYLRHASDGDPRVWKGALAGLEALMTTDPDLTDRIAAPLADLARGRREALRENLNLLFLLKRDFGEKGRDMGILMRDEARLLQRWLFGALGLMSDPGLLRIVRHRISGGDPRQRADALETLETLGFKDIVQPLLVTLDHQVLEEGLPPVWGTMPSSPEALLDRLATHRAAMIRAGVLLYLSSHRPDLAPGGVRKLRDDPDPLVREVVLWSERALTPNPEKAMISTIEKILYLKTIPMFAGLDAVQLRLLAGVVEEQERPAQDLIFVQNDAPDALYMIVHGATRITRQINGQTTLLLVQGEHTYFGEMGFLDGQPRSGTAMTTEPTILLTLSHDAFKDAIKDEPDIALNVLSEITGLLRKSRIAEENALLESSHTEATPALIRA